MDPLLIEPRVLNDRICFLTRIQGLTDGFLFLSHPDTQWEAHTPGEVVTVLNQAEAAARSGMWVAGFLAYEAAGAFGLPVLPPQPDHPLVWMASFSRVHRGLLPDPSSRLMASRGQIDHFDIDFPRYRQDLQAILEAIGRGETYQVNHTLTATIAPCDPGELFLRLQGLHRFPFGAWLNFGTGRVASFSPELFLAATHGRIITAPIKGTRPRSNDVLQDQQAARSLEHSIKDRAEHVMIVDMARNDLGRICMTGSVRPGPICERRSFSTIHHLETRIEGQLRPGIGLAAIMEALFPAASITGAPKKRTMDIIRQREQRPRGIYTGSLGILAPGGDRWNFNVAIRSVVWLGNGIGHMGLGGGIVADSQIAAEWRELEDKGRFLTHPPEPFGLIETCLVDGEGTIPRLDAHLRRLAQSASTLGFPCPTQEIGEKMQRQARSCHPRPRVLRVVLDMGGRVTLTERDWTPPPTPNRSIRIAISPAFVDRLDPMTRHKTTRRQLFDHCLFQARQRGLEDCLFRNTLGHITEGAIRALAVRFSDGWVVPPLEDGLLPSLWREEFVQTHTGVREQSLSVANLTQAREIVMGNAVGGSVTVAGIIDEYNHEIYRQPDQEALPDFHSTPQT
ncbi:MAG: bifunctional anthranilate synthase component I family protein/class IV aminotransferase [Magnetococcales bacterium]|nr:bifunctional anthranilate synthase component I family protein/class IV aminotransferase [Magnetococcales bacterium]